MVRKYNTSLAIFLKASALLVSLSSGYGRAFAGSCVGALGTYLCSGAAAFPPGTDTTQNLSAPNLTVTTVAGFGIDVSAGPAFNLVASGSGITFIDSYFSGITGATNGIWARNSGSGALSISSSGTVSGGIHGIYATNSGSGALSISSSGAVTSTISSAIIALNSSSGTDLTIATANVSGGSYGIRARNYGSGALSISSSGPITGASSRGIETLNYSAGTDLTIATTNVSGATDGIFAVNYGSGALSISSSGMVAGTSGYGIFALNYGGTDLTIATADVSGADGIYAVNYGSGGLSITTSGTVTGTSGYGIFAGNDGGQPTTITVGGQSIVQGQIAGIQVDSTLGQSATINVFGQVGNLSGLTTDDAIISSDGPTTVNLFAGSVTTGGVTLGDYSDTVSLAGTLDGSITMNGGNDTFIQTGGSTLTGTVDGGGGIDTLGFNNMGTLDGSLLGVRYLNFENLGIYGGSTTLTGIWDFSTGTVTIYQGSLYVDGTLMTSLLTVGSSGWLIDNGTLISGTLDIQAGGRADINGIATVYGDTTVDGLLNVDSSGLFTTDTLTVNSGGTASILGTVNVHGATDIFGSLYVDGSLTTTLLTVESGGFLAGNGSIFGDVTIYGTISPGHSIGTLNIDGSLSFMPGSTYIAELAADGNSDLIRVNGPVSISGGTVKAYLPIALYTNGYNWHIITATGGISGSFSSIDTNFTSYTIKLEQQIQGDSLDLVIVRTPYAGFGATKNQTAVGSALDSILPSATGSMANLLISMDFAMDPSQLSATLKGLNPEMYTAFPAAGLAVAGIFNRMVAMRQLEGEVAATDKEQLWNVWGEMLGHRLDRDTEDGISGYTLDTEGSVFGMDRAFGQASRAGLIFGYSSSDLSFSDPGNSGEIDGKHIGFYTTTHLGGFTANGTAGYTSLDNGANRAVTTPVFTTTTAGSFKSNVFAGNLQSGYDFTFGNIRVGPTVSLDYQYLDQHGFSEKGGQDFAVRIKDGNAESLTGLIGIRLTDVIESGNWRFVPRAEADYVHQFLDDDTTLTCSFTGYPASTFSVDGAEPDANAALAILGLSALYNKRLSLHLNVSATFAEQQNSQLLAGGLTWTF